MLGGCRQYFVIEGIGKQKSQECRRDREAEKSGVQRG